MVSLFTLGACSESSLKVGHWPAKIYYLYGDPILNMSGLCLSWYSEDVPQNTPAFFSVRLCIAESFGFLKRKAPGSSSSESESGVLMPKGKKICKFISEHLASVTNEASMSQGEGAEGDLAAQLQLVLQKLKLETMVQGVLQKFTDFETTVKSIKGEIATLEDRTNAVEKSLSEMDNGLKFMNNEVEDLKSKVNENEREIKCPNDRILYQDVYSHMNIYSSLAFPSRSSLRKV